MHTSRVFDPPAADALRVHALHRERGARAIGRDQIPAGLAQTARERDETGRIRS